MGEKVKFCESLLYFACDIRDKFIKHGGTRGNIFLHYQDPYIPQTLLSKVSETVRF